MSALAAVAQIVLAQQAAVDPVGDAVMRFMAWLVIVAAMTAGTFLALTWIRSRFERRKVE